MPLENIEYEYVNNSWVKESRETYYYSTKDVTGIVELSEVEFTIYPNPTNGMVTIGTGQEEFTDIRVFDGLGRLVLTKTIHSSSNFSVDLSNYPGGVYTLFIGSDKFIAARKIILRF